MAEEADRLSLLGILGVDPLKVCHVEPIVVTIDERGDESALVEDPDALRRRIDEVGVACIEAIGGEKLADQDR